MAIRDLPKEILNRRAYTSNSYTDFLLSQLRRDWIIEPEKDFAWRQDQEIYEKLRLDSRYRAVEETLLCEIAALEWDIVSEEDNKQISEIYKWLVNKVGGFCEARMNLSRAVVEGMAVLDPVWGYTFEQAPGDTKKRRWVVPKKLRFISRERLRRSIHIDSNRKSWWVWRIYDPYLNRWLPIVDEGKYIWSFYRATEENLGYGEGLAKSVYSMIKLKVVLLELLAAGAERWVDSWILVKLDETMKETADLHDDGSIAKLMEDISKMRAYGVLAHQGADIQIAPAGQSNTASAILDMIEKIDREITILMTATNLPTDIQSGGSFAATQGQMEQQNKRLLFQRKSVVEEPLTDHLLKACRRHNKHNLAAMGLDHHQTPYFSLSGGEILDTQERTAVFDLASRLGVDIAEEDFRSQLKLSVPTGKVIKLPSPAQFPSVSSPGGFSGTSYLLEKPPLIFQSTPQVLEDLPEEDQKEEDPAMEAAIWKLGRAILGKSTGKGEEAVEEAEDEFAEIMRKALLYYELRGREEILMAAKEAEDEFK